MLNSCSLRGVSSLPFFFSSSSSLSLPLPYPIPCLPTTPEQASCPRLLPMTTLPPFPPTCRSAAAQHTIGDMRIEHCIVLLCFFFGGVLFFELPSSHVFVLPQHIFAHLVLSCIDIVLKCRTSLIRLSLITFISQTFSLTIAGVPQHLISYYKPADVESGRLRTPSSVPELAALEIAAEYLDKTHFRIPPRIDVGRDGRMRYVGEAEDEDDGGAGTTGAGGGLENGVGVIGGRGLLQDVSIGPDMNSMARLGDFPSMSSMSSMNSMGGTSPTTSRRAKRMEPYPTLQGLSDPGMAGGSSGVGTKRRRRTNTNLNSTSSQPSQGQGQTQSHSLGHVHPPPPALMGMTMSMTDGGAGMYTQSPTTSPRSIGVGLSPAHSHGGNGGHCKG
jgi:hypothetical protein